MHIYRIAANRQVPFLEDRLPDQDLDQFVDVSHLLVWIDTTDGEAVTHARTGSDAVRHSIDTAVFRWKMDHVFSVFDDNKRLGQIFDLLVVDQLHILSHTDLLVVVDKLLVNGIGVVVNITDLIGAFITPICDYR